MVRPSAKSRDLRWWTDHEGPRRRRRGLRHHALTRGGHAGSRPSAVTWLAPRGLIVGVLGPAIGRAQEWLPPQVKRGSRSATGIRSRQTTSGHRSGPNRRRPHSVTGFRAATRLRGDRPVHAFLGVPFADNKYYCTPRARALRTHSPASMTAANGTLQDFESASITSCSGRVSSRRSRAW
jgi:hypothetical protein